MKKMIHNLSKRTKSVIAACLAFIMVFGIIAVISPVEAHAVTINASDLGFNSSNYYNAGSNTFTQGAKIRVINTSRSGKSKSDAIYTYAAGSWMPVDSTKYLVWDGNGNNTFHAVTPATDYAEYTSFTIPTNQSDDDSNLISNADWMTASYTGAKGENGDINLNFEHRLAMVTIKINKWNSEFDDSNKTISDPKINSAAKKVNVTYGTGENSTDVYSGDGTLTAITPKVGTDGETFTAIVAPLKYNVGDKFMTFKVGDEEFSVYVTESLDTEGIEAGKHYTFNLTVGKERVTIEKVTVTDWNNTTINGGVAEEVVPQINATAMTAEQLNAAVAKLLTVGMTDIEITMSANSDFKMFNAIRRALIDTAGVKDGSINLTLKGVTTIPRSMPSSADGESITFGARDDEKVTQLASVNLPDVVEIEFSAFNCCENLISCTAPKVQTIGSNAFSASGLTSVNFSEATTIENWAFDQCESLTAVELPKATLIGDKAFYRCQSLTTVKLTATGNISVAVDSFNNAASINLVLNSDKKSKVTENTWSTKNMYNQDAIITFKSITFAD